MRAAIAIALITLALPANAACRWGDTVFSESGEPDYTVRHRQVGNCHRDPRRHHHHHHRQDPPRVIYRDRDRDDRDYRDHTRVYSYEERIGPNERRWERDYNRSHPEDKGLTCETRMSVIGPTALGAERALQLAELAWRTNVNFMWGPRYMAFDTARSYRKQCVRASVNDSATGKMGEAIFGESAVRDQCQVSAVPCKKGMESSDPHSR